MKNRVIAALWLLAIVVGVYSCKTSTYADQRKAEKAKLSSYITDNGLIIKEGATDSLALLDSSNVRGTWPEKTYFKTYNGAYVRIKKIDKMTEEGKIVERTPETGNTIVMRWKTYDLDGNLTGDNTNPTESREGTVFVYTPGGTTPSQGWNACIPFMRHNCQAEFIIDSTIGPSEQQSAVITLRVDVLDFTVRN